MPAPETLGLFALTAVALVAVPGPNLLYIANRALADGRRAGMASVLGVETGTLVWVCSAAAGLSALLASSAVAFDVVRYAGAAYLIYLGVRTLRAREEDGVPAGPAPASLGRAYREGLLVQLSNPKVAVFFLALLPQFVVEGRGPAATQILVLGLVLACVGVSISSAWALGAGALGERLRSARARRMRRRVTGGVYLLLGGAAAVFSGRS